MIPDSALIKYTKLEGIIARPTSELAITIKKDRHKFLVRLRDGTERWLSLQDQGVTWE